MKHGISRTAQAAELRSQMRSLGLDQGQLGALVGRTPAAVSKWATGNCPVPPFVFTVLARHAETVALRKAADDLFKRLCNGR